MNAKQMFEATYAEAKTWENVEKKARQIRTMILKADDCELDMRVSLGVNRDSIEKVMERVNDFLKAEDALSIEWEDLGLRTYRIYVWAYEGE